MLRYLIIMVINLMILQYKIMANLAIRGHATRGKEVIEILEMLGGNNPYNYSADCDSLCFYIDKSTNTIYRDLENNCYEDENILVFTLEQFEEKFPYKVGDKVQYRYATFCGSVFEVEKMKWVNNHIQYTIKDLQYNNCHSIVTAEDLQPFEETMNKASFDANAQCCDIMKEKLKQIILDIPDGYEFFGINDDNKVVLTKKQPQYPKIYEECCIIIGFNSDTLKLNNPFNINRDTHPYIKHLDNLIESFCKLHICRDAYWKIAGEQMGLDKPWEPDWLDTNTQKYCIYYVGDEIKKQPMLEVHHFLAFPTAEIRDVFYENFKELIENCKEVL